MTLGDRRAALGRRLGRLWSRRAVILLYHRIAEPEVDPWRLAVSPARFDEHMAVLRRRATVVPLDELPGILARRGAPRRLAAVTFDDGYADNLHRATPILARHDVPATIFVAAGAVGGHEFWWDRLARLLLLPGTLPARLRLEVRIEVGARPLGWELGDWATYPVEAFAAHRGWSAVEEPPTPRHALFLALWRELKSMPPAAQRRLMDELTAWAGAAGGSPPEVGMARAMTHEELAVAAGHGLLGVGGHTVSHARLSALADDEQRGEIAGCRRMLEETTGRPVTSFSYPYGQGSDFTAATTAMVREAGFERACVNASGTVGPDSDPYLLPRLYVTDCDGDALAARLARRLGAIAR